MTTDTAFAAVLGALDGDLSVQQVLDAVAQILELDPSQITVDMLAKLRKALEEQYLVPEGS